jgi:predicted oxidoreductase
MYIQLPNHVNSTLPKPPISWSVIFGVNAITQQEVTRYGQKLDVVIPAQSRQRIEALTEVWIIRHPMHRYTWYDL